MSQEEIINRYLEDQAKKAAIEQEKQSFRPILVLCFPPLTKEQRQKVEANSEKWKDMLLDAGWIGFILDGFEKMDVRAFGVPESELGTLEELKKLIEDNQNKR